MPNTVGTPTSTSPLVIDCAPLSTADVVGVARHGRRVVLGDVAVSAMERSRRLVEDVVSERRVVYGVTTGFGKFADRVIPPDSLKELQRNLIVSHAVGTGSPLEPEVVRAMTMLRVAALARGYSGIRPSTVQTLVDILNAGIIPVIPSKGSVGASGDLAPLAHLSLLLIGEGDVLQDGTRIPATAALRSAGIKPVTLEAKEGLALINGTQLMAALGVLLLDDACNVLDVADVAGAMTLDAMRGTNTAFDARIQKARPHPGQIEVAARLRRLTEGSEIMASHRHDAHKVQDPYSLRCMPQVHGASRDALAYARGVLEIEINAASDNPLIFPADGDIVSGGNFHGQPLAFALDFAAIALAELADISERRIAALLDPSFSELPPFLALNGGVESGFMAAQYTAASLVSENKVLAHPASVDSIPTSANQEDHVSMGVTSGLKAGEVLKNVESVLAIELLCAAAGIDFRRPLRSSPSLEATHALIRSEVAALNGDRSLHRDLEVVTSMVRDRRVRSTADEAALG
jgi:histidine ammonia-lyase